MLGKQALLQRLKKTFFTMEAVNEPATFQLVNYVFVAARHLSLLFGAGAVTRYSASPQLQRTFAYS
jgi:hypothetical protein